MSPSSQSPMKTKLLLRMVVGIPVLAGIGFGVLWVGLSMSFDALNRLRIESNQYSWATTSAQVTKSVRSNRRQGEECFFEYEYLVAGQVFEGDLYSIKEFTPCRGVDQFDVGERLDIYYDPARPRNAVVVREGTSAWTQCSLSLIAVMAFWIAFDVGRRCWGIWSGHNAAGAEESLDSELLG